MDQQLINLCATLKGQGLTWPQIAIHVMNNTTFRDPNGKPYHNAALAAGTLSDPSGASVRQRAPKPKVKANVKSKQSKPKAATNVKTKQSKPKVGRPTKAAQVVNIIETLTKAGVSAKTLAKVLKEVV